MTGPCHINGDGWLYGPIAIDHMWSPNREMGFAEPARGVVLHTEAGYEAGTVATFMNPATQVSAFFSIAGTGAVTQYMPVGQGWMAWTQADGNSRWRGVECEDLTHPGTPLTDAQLTAFAQVFEALSHHDGFPLQTTEGTTGRGLTWHGAGGQAWGNHPDCPGRVRKRQRPEIVARAKAIRAERGDGVLTQWKSTGTMDLAQAAAAHNTVPSTMLRILAVREGRYPPDVAAWLNDLFGGKILPTAPVPAGLTFWVAGS